ncbi:MAG: DNA internalization-related competence protein ComEC/Rec2 [Clostridia bacterium]|nr:DNA internalization-related competence protein ComEC/Rec2 [Clostridia bacterium]
MKRPLVLFSAAQILGIITGHLFRTFIFAAISVFLLCVFAAAMDIKKKGMRLIFACTIIFFTIGIFEFLLFDLVNAGKFKAFDGKEALITGYFDSEADIRDNRIQYVVRTESVVSEGRSCSIKGKVLFTTLRKEGAPIYGYGRRVAINGQLNLPKGVRNPGGFDYRRYLAQSGISALVFAKDYGVKQENYAKKGFLNSIGMSVRDRVVKVIERSLPRQQAGLLNGMLIGYREGMGEEVEKSFSDAGLSHLVAVSGMNVAFIIAPLLFVFKRLKISDNISNGITIGALVLFLFVTGFSPSVARAVIMGISILTGKIIMRETDVINSLGLAAIILLAYNPYTLFDIGFQLSFAATLSIILFYKTIREFVNFKFIPAFAADVLSVTLAAQIGVLPVTAYYFNKVSIISLFSNIIAVPLVEAVTVLGFIMAVIGQFSIVLSQIIGYINCVLLSFILLVSDISSRLPFAVLRIATPPAPAVLLYYALALGLLWNAKLSKIKHVRIFYWSSGAVILAALFVGNLLPKGLQVTYIDVGQGDSSLVRTNTGRAVLIDGGGEWAGESVVIPLLLDYGLTKLDMVIATHGHDDHILGLKPVLSQFAAGCLVLPDNPDDKGLEDLIRIAEARKIPVIRCNKGDDIRIDKETAFKVLHPDGGNSFEKSPLNNNSLVLRLSYKDISLLFTGDVEKEAEQALSGQSRGLEADVLKVAHHGADTSTTDEFVSAVRPKAAVISVGRNSFGHPASSTLKRLEESRVILLRTDLHGGILLQSDGKGIKIKKTIKD